MGSAFHPPAAEPGSADAPPTTPAVPPGPEVVIRQARARQRRRRRRTAVVVAAVVMISGTFYLAVGRPSGAKPSPASLGGPVPRVNMAAFAGHGELALVSRGTLWVLDGATRALRRVVTPGVTPSAPVFSPDGRWLAFTGTSISPAGQAGTVWLAAGDGSEAHQVVASGGLIGWSPAADLLAVTAGNTVRLIRPSGAARTLMRAARIQSAAWSPGGTSLAVATGSASAETLASYPVAGGRPVIWLRQRARSDLAGIIDLAGWWPRQGIGYWALGDCASCNADGDVLFVIGSPGARPRPLGATLAGAGLDQVAAAPNGWLAIVAEKPGPGLGRLIWQDRRIAVCGAAAPTCTAVPSPPGTITLDPAWSPDGTTLAFARAPTRATPNFPQPVVARWYGAHQLWLYHPATHSVSRLSAPGATVPAWSANGRSLLYAARDGLWLLPRPGGHPAQIATPLFQPGNWPSYYGQVSWAAQFAWWSGQ